MPKNPEHHDSLIWGITPNANFTFKSCYNALIGTIKSESFSWIWKLPVPPKVRHFIWLCSHDRLPTTSYLHKIQIMPNIICPTCKAPSESTTHMFFQCSPTRTIWTNLGILKEIDTIHNNSLQPLYWLKRILLTATYPPLPYGLPPKIFLTFCLWHIWLNRNRNAFENCPKSSRFVLELLNIII